MTEPRRTPSPFGNPNRLEAFSDGVFAIAITLLVLEIKPPATAEHATSAALWRSLAHLWPSYGAYLLAFVTILVAWIGHHMIVRQVERVDGRLLLANGFFLLTISFLPFPTAVVAEHLRHPSAAAAVTFYVLVNLLNSLAFFGLARTALTLQEHDTAAQHKPMRNAISGVLVCLVCAGIAQVSPLIALLLIGALWLWWLASSLRF